MTLWARADVRDAFGKQLRQREESLRAGSESVGWKLGFGTPAAMGDLGIDAPLIGYLIDRTRLESGSTFSLGGLANPKIETEIALYMDRDLPAEPTLDDCRRAIGGIGLAFEIVDLPVGASALDLLEHNVAHRAVILGAPQAPGSVVPTVSVAVDGHEAVADADPTAAVGPLLELVHHVAVVLGALDGGLGAGSVVITGAAATPLVPAATERHLAVADGLPEVEVEFAV